MQPLHTSLTNGVVISSNHPWGENRIDDMPFGPCEGQRQNIYGAVMPVAQILLFGATVAIRNRPVWKEAMLGNSAFNAASERPEDFSVGSRIYRFRVFQQGRRID